jgi:hypothetical protein
VFSKRSFDVWRSRGVKGSEISVVLWPSPQSNIDEKLMDLENFTKQSDFSSSRDLPDGSPEIRQRYMPEPPEEEKAWVDHRVWLDELSYSLTISQQPERLLKIRDLANALRTKV